MISSLRRSEASARSSIARSCAFSLVTASCSAAPSIDGIGAPLPESRVARDGKDPQHGKRQQADQRTDDGGQSQEGQRVGRHQRR